MSKKTRIIIGILVVGILVLGYVGKQIFPHEKKPVPEADKESARQRLSQVKVAVLYENINDGVFIVRSIDETIDILKDTHTDLIFRGFWKWAPVVESPDNIPPELLELAKDRNLSPEQISESLRESGHYYQELKRWISAIKKEMPDIIFVGAIPAQTLGRIEWNPITGKVYTTNETWQMALDPAKWGIKRNGKLVTKERFQKWFYGVHPYGGKLEKEYDWRKAPAYFPDITNADFQELLLSWAKKQIDCGADAIWIDMLYNQAKLLVQMTRDTGHPAVKESFAAATKIIDEIHKYGELEGKYIYVGSWASRLIIELGLPYSAGNADFITITPSNEEILNKRLNEKKWNQAISIIRKFYSDIPIFAFIDWAFDESQTVMFSQKLSKDEQKQALKAFDESFLKLGVNFIYPLHGGYMGRGKITTKLSFGKDRIYDSLAPEFRTYETIKELAQSKSGRDGRSDIPTKPEEVKKEVKVAIQYRWVTDHMPYRSLDEIVNIFKETKADFIYQGWLTQWYLFNTYDEVPLEVREKYREHGYSYQDLKKAVSKIKQELPNVIFCGGTLFEFFYPDELQEVDKDERRDKAWKMSLNPEKWGINFSRRDMQCYWAKRWGFVDKKNPCPSEEELRSTMRCYFPDITNPDFQKVFLKRMYRQIDAGVDALWIDMLYMQPALLQERTKDENHPAVQESYKAIWDVVEKIHEYGLKKGKKIYVITWVAVERGGSIIKVPKTNVDFATLSPEPNEIRDKNTGRIGEFDERMWDELIRTIREEYGIPIFARIDYGGIGRSPLSVFSQELTKEEARYFLKKANEFFTSKNITFIYPVHGGDMETPGRVDKRSYGKWNWYDSEALEFETYETVKELAQSKK